MSTIEDFENAPVGATATHANGSRIRAMKMDEVDRYWMTQNGVFHSEPERRTLEPLPEPEPDWLNAPAVMARVEGWVSCADPQVFTRYDYEAAPSEWLYHGSEKPFRWQDLRDVTPLWPKWDAAYSSHYDEPWCTWLGGEPHDINEK